MVEAGKYIEHFYEGFPEIELESKLYAVECCHCKLTDFTASNLATFIDQKYYNTAKDNNIKFVRSIQSCCLELRQWGFHFNSNSKRPYFDGHEWPTSRKFS